MRKFLLECGVKLPTAPVFHGCVLRELDLGRFRDLEEEEFNRSYKSNTTTLMML